MCSFLCLTESEEKRNFLGLSARLLRKPNIHNRRSHWWWVLGITAWPRNRIWKSPMEEKSRIFDTTTNTSQIQTSTPCHLPFYIEGDNKCLLWCTWWKRPNSWPEKWMLYHDYVLYHSTSLWDLTPTPPSQNQWCNIYDNYLIFPVLLYLFAHNYGSPWNDVTWSNMTTTLKGLSENYFHPCFHILQKRWSACIVWR